MILVSQYEGLPCTVFGGPVYRIPHTVFSRSEDRTGCQGLSDEHQTWHTLSSSHDARGVNILPCSALALQRYAKRIKIPLSTVFGPYKATLPMSDVLTQVEVVARQITTSQLPNDGAF